MGFFKNIFGFSKRDEKPAEVQTSDVNGCTATAISAADKDAKVLKPLIAFLRGMAESLAIERIETLTLREAVTRMVEGRPEADNMSKGALSVTAHREGKLVLWMYLDRKDNLMRHADGRPAVFKAICGAIDDELAQLLGGSELLIME